jgi:hypothetical protein
VAGFEVTDSGYFSNAVALKAVAIAHEEKQVLFENTINFVFS